jgi:hypothetical protein
MRLCMCVCEIVTRPSALVWRSQDTERECAALGAEETIVKPFKMEVVLGRITAAMSRVRLRSWVSAKIAADAVDVSGSRHLARELAASAPPPVPGVDHGSSMPLAVINSAGSGSPASAARPGALEARLADLEDVRLALMETIEDMQARAPCARRRCGAPHARAHCPPRRQRSHRSTPTRGRSARP